MTDKSAEIFYIVHRLFDINCNYGNTTFCISHKPICECDMLKIYVEKHRKTVRVLNGHISSVLCCICIETMCSLWPDSASSHRPFHVAIYWPRYNPARETSVFHARHSSLAEWRTEINNTVRVSAQMNLPLFTHERNAFVTSCFHTHTHHI